MKALNETEKLKSSSETYKKDQLMQQLSDKEEELQRAQDQAASLVSDNDGDDLYLGFAICCHLAITDSQALQRCCTHYVCLLQAAS